MDKTTTAIALLACLLLPGGAAATVPSERAERLDVGLFSSEFLAAIASRIETARTEAARRAGGYLDEDTGLVWATADTNADVDWYEAGEHCRELEIADWSDWRLPTIEELETLHKPRAGGIYKLTSSIRLSGCCPWSSTPSEEGSAWNFSFRYRKRFSGSLNYSFQLRALCVRAATPEDIVFFEEVAEQVKEYAKLKRKGKL